MIQHYAVDTKEREIHAFTDESERTAFCQTDRSHRQTYSDTYALASFEDGWPLYLHGESYVPNYWREYVAWDVEPTSEPDVYLAFSDIHSIAA